MTQKKVRCIYCGMAVTDGQTKAHPSGEVLSFCDRECAIRFDLLGPVAFLRGEIVGNRAEIIEALEAERGSKVITLIHRREPWSASKEEAYITLEDSEAVVAAIRKTDAERPIDLILHTPGGVGLAAESISMALKHHPGRTSVIVPHYAMSGGSLIALAADEILLEPESILGPVDPQVGHFAAGTLLRLLRRKPIEAISDEMVILAETAKLSLEQVKEFVKWLLEGKVEKRQQEALSTLLTGGYLSHDTPIVLQVLRGYGLPVKEGIPDKVHDLFQTFVFGACERPGGTTY